MNLISNAIKYTLEGTILLKIEKILPSKIRISVKDTGIGLTNSQIRNIFMSRNNCSNFSKSILIHRECGVPGIGLSVTQIICQKMQSQLQVESQKNKGTTFYFDVPIDINHKSMQLPVNQFPEQISFEENKSRMPTNILPIEKITISSLIEERNDSNKFEIPSEFMTERKYNRPSVFNYHISKLNHSNLVIIVVDDISLNRIIIRSILNKLGYKAREAADGSEAVDLFRKLWDPKHQFLIFMDLQMPIKDGYNASKEIRQIAGSFRENPFIVAITAFAAEQERKCTFSAGMNCFKSKLITSTDVKDILSLLS